MTTTEWTAWQGGECPVAPETLVEPIDRSGFKYEVGPASIFRWDHRPEDNPFRGSDIVSYRVVSPLGGADELQRQENERVAGLTFAPPTAVQAAVEVEREACAQIAERFGILAAGQFRSHLGIAAAIRARGNVEGKS